MLGLLYLRLLIARPQQIMFTDMTDGLYGLGVE